MVLYGNPFKDNFKEYVLDEYSSLDLQDKSEEEIDEFFRQKRSEEDYDKELKQLLNLYANESHEEAEEIIQKWNTLPESEKSRYILKDEYEKKKEEWNTKWKNNNGISDAEFEILELLHKQYLAISEYSINPTDSNAIQIISDTYRKTRINCLKYLQDVRSESQWKKLSNDQEANICAIIVGFDPIYRKEEKNEKKLQSRHDRFNHYISVIESIHAKDIENSKLSQGVEGYIDGQ